MISFTTPSTKDQANRLIAIDRLITIAQELLRIQLNITDISITVMELQCTEPNCPPLETAFAVLDKNIDCKFKVIKKLEEVHRNDIVDAIQSWVRGDEPPCGCEIPMNQGSNAAVTATASLPLASSSEPDEEMRLFMQNLESGVM